MKTILLSMIALAFVTFNTNSTIAGGKKEKITIQTSAQCGECESRITEALNKVDGVKSTTFDATTKSVTVLYDAEKTNADTIRAAIAETGYDADEKAANADAYKKLPQCCKKGGL